MTKSKSGEVVDLKMTFVLLPSGKYLFSAVSDNGYITGSNKENVLSIAISANVSDAKKTILLITIPFLDFLMIY